MMHEAALKEIRKSDVSGEAMLDQFIDTMDAMEKAEATLTQRIREKVIRETQKQNTPL
jgi:CHASE3 domain sensor protein